jgi:hypothetical protein
MERIYAGPHTSECISTKGSELLFKLGKYKIQWLLAISQILQ